jgi:transcription initiation factor TFIIF subunit alpha
VTKRKASEDSSVTAAGVSAVVAPKPKKRKSQGGLGVTMPPTEELDDKMVIDWLRSKINPTTRDCIQHFTPYLTDEVKKGKFTALVKEVAILKGGVLVLKNAYRGDSAAGSPAPVVA